MFRTKRILSAFLVIALLLGIIRIENLTANAKEEEKPSVSNNNIFEAIYDETSKTVSIAQWPDNAVYMILAGYENGKMVFSEVINELSVAPTSWPIPASAKFDTLKIFCLDASYSPIAKARQVYPNVPNYEELPLRADRPYNELVELNDGEDPYIEMNDNGRVGLYIGKISDNKVDDVYDVIAELNNIRGILNIEDARFEFVPCYEDGRIDDTFYRVQQVHNGVPVLSGQIIVSVDEEGYISGFTSYYTDNEKLCEINTENQITSDRVVEIIREHASSNYEEIVFLSNPILTIIPESSQLVWLSSICCDGERYVYYIDAHTGSINGIIKNRDVEVSVFLDDGTFEDAACNLYGTPIPITKITETRSSNGGVQADTYILYDRSYYNAYLKDGNPNNWGVAVYNSVDANGARITSTDAPGFPYEIISSETNSWDPDHNSVHHQGLYALYQFGRTMDVYGKNGFVVDMPLEINVNIDYENACYAYSNSKDTAIKFCFGKTSTLNTIRSLDLVAHEYTHMVQDYYVGVLPEKWYLDWSLGDGYQLFWDASKNEWVYEEATSSNINWVEAKAISEGTADIMAMLVEAICEGVPVTDPDFFVIGEDATSDFSGVRNHSATNTKGHQTVQEMITAYQGTNLKYGKGPGHLDCYIVVGILRHLIENTDLSLSQLFKLWHTTISLLNAKSEFDGLRYSLVLAATKHGLDGYIDNINEACDSVGITDNRKDTDFNAWFYDGVEKAYQNNIITIQQAEGDLQAVTSRYEYLQLLANLCASNSIDVGSDAVSWAKNIGVIGDTWTGSYLDANISRWQAALLLYQTVNYYVQETGCFGNHGWKSIYSYPFIDSKGTDYYALFKNLGFSDWGLYISNPDFKEMSQYYKNCDTVTKFQMQYMYSNIESKSYITNTQDSDTNCALYYTGFYQLWRNGMFTGRHNSSGELRLGATDSFTFGEACALITQVIPD